MKTLCDLNIRGTYYIKKERFFTIKVTKSFEIQRKYINPVKKKNYQRPQEVGDNNQAIIFTLLTDLRQYIESRYQFGRQHYATNLKNYCIIILRKMYFPKLFREIILSNKNFPLSHLFHLSLSSFSFYLRASQETNSQDRFVNTLMSHSHRTLHEFKVLTSLPTFRSGQRLRKVGSRKFDYQEWRQLYPRYHVQLIVASVASAQVSRLCRRACCTVDPREKGHFYVCDKGRIYPFRDDELDSSSQDALLFSFLYRFLARKLRSVSYATIVHLFIDSL